VRLVERNWANHVADVRLFEIGTVFEPAAAGRRPREARQVAGVVTGRRAPAHWSDAQPEPFDLWDLKGCFEAAVALANPAAQIQVQGTGWVARDGEGRIVGHAGPLTADAPPWASPLYGFEVTLDATVRRPPRFVALPTTPASARVLALLLPVGVTVRVVEALLRRVGEPLLERIDVESDYRGPGLEAGVRSVAFRLSFRAADRTLRDAEVDELEARLLAALADELGIRRRDAAAATATHSGG
jgi:phenylalanyl-tRNA synthetase beta chain